MAFLNEQHAQYHPEHRDLAARKETYELACRMQMEVPDVIDLKGETDATREMYGMDDKHIAPFGRQCLLARRLVEKGVRFVQIFSGGWDSHDYLERAHAERIRSVDKPRAALPTTTSAAAFIPSAAAATTRRRRCSSPAAA